MSYSPATGLVYIPAMMSSALYIDDPVATDRKTVWNTNYSGAAMVALPDDLTVEERAGLAALSMKGVLVARNPVTNEEVWQRQLGFYAGGGILSTQGNLLFQGDIDGNFTAYTADTGEPLWTRSVKSGVMAGPISYELDGEQYIAVAQGWGGETAVPFGSITGPLNLINISRVLVYKLGGHAELPEVELKEQTLPAHSLAASSAEEIEQGRKLFDIYCLVCHGGNAISAGLVPDLRYRIGDIATAWQAIVMNGALASNGMPGWADYISSEEADQIKAYVAHEATLGHQRGEKRLIRK